MADTKISALPASTTPLAGTEVLPIVQGGATVKVSVANLTAGRAVSATQMTLTTGNLIVASGQGIDFSADGQAAGMTSELLDDYEEGIFTATIKGGTTDPTTPQTGSGYYTKIGRQVTVLLSIDAFDSTGAAGQIQISGMPFAAQAGLPRTVGQMYFSRATNSPIMPLIEPSGTLLKAVDAQGNSVNYNSAGAFTYTSVSITYIV